MGLLIFSKPISVESTTKLLESRSLPSRMQQLLQAVKVKKKQYNSVRRWAESGLARSFICILCWSLFLTLVLGSAMHTTKSKFSKLWKNIGLSLNGYTALKWLIALSFIGFFLLHGMRFIVYPLFVKDSWHAESWHEDLYELLGGIVFDILLSFFFYYLLVFVPEYRRKKIIKNNFNHNFMMFKERVIPMLVEAGAITEQYDVKKLTDIHAFKSFFYDRWEIVFNGLNANPQLMHKVTSELSFLREEINFMLGRVEISDDTLFRYLSDTSYRIYHYQNVQPGTDDAKAMVHFVWQLLTGYSWITGGYPEKDPMEVAVERA